MIDYELFLDCVHCGLCTSACPTYVELGDENDSPRGRIYLMRALTDGRLELNDEVRRHLDLCLDCRLRVGVPVGGAVRPADRAVPHPPGEDRPAARQARAAQAAAAVPRHAVRAAH